MPLDDLVSLGYSVSESPAHDGSMWTVSGHGVVRVVVPDEIDAAVAELQNRASQESLIRQALTYFADKYQNWDTLTAAQKDTANKQAQRALANIARWLLDDFSSAGS